MDADETSTCAVPATMDKVESGAELDATDAPRDEHISKDDDAKLLFGNGKLERWLMERRAVKKRSTIKTLDGWLSPSKTASLPVARSRTPTPENSPAKLKRKRSVSHLDSASESSDVPPSPSADIREYFASKVTLQSAAKNEHNTDDLDSESESLDTVTVIDFVEDDALRATLEQSYEASDRISNVTLQSAASKNEQKTDVPASEAESVDTVNVIDLVEDNALRATSEQSYEASDRISNVTLQSAASNNEQKTDVAASEAECVDTVNVIDLVDDNRQGQTSEANNAIVLSQDEATAAEANTQYSSSQGNSSIPSKTTSLEQSLEWWATSRTKSSTRKGPFKRSLGLVHFVNEVRFA